MAKPELQKEDLEAVAQLFDLAGGLDGEDEDVWGQRFEQHISTTMQRHVSAVKRLRSGAERQCEQIRAHHELLVVVQERLLERLQSSAQQQVAEPLQQLFEVMASLFQSALQCAMELAAADVERVASKTGAPQARPGDGAERRPERQEERPPPSPGASEAGAARAEAPRPQKAQAAGGRAYAQIHDARREHARQAKFVGRPPAELDLQQLKDIIRILFTSKKEADQRAKASSAPCETMEQHFYAWLARQYKSVALVDEWARVIILAIQKYAPTCCEVSTFGKVLQHRLSEDQIGILEALKETLRQLMQKKVKDRHAGMTLFELDIVWRDWQREGVPLGICEQVVRHMYNDLDSEEVLPRVRAAASPPDGSPEVARVSLRELREALGRFQVGLAEFHASDFLRMFGDVNRDAPRSSVGVIQAEQAEQLAAWMADTTEQEDLALHGSIEQLAEEYETVRRRLASVSAVTYSECVDDLFAGMISARWDARGGLSACRRASADAGQEAPCMPPSERRRRQ